jgi:hypothetical protein
MLAHAVILRRASISGELIRGQFAGHVLSRLSHRSWSRRAIGESAAIAEPASRWFFGFQAIVGLSPSPAISRAAIFHISLFPQEPDKSF